MANIISNNKHTSILVLGMHRSGTSALTGVLHKLGVDLGDKLMQGINGINDAGFFEHEEIIGIHDDLLEAIGSSWLDMGPMPDNWWKSETVKIYKEKIKNILHREFGDSQVWGIKDPRLCRLLPIWLDILDNIGCGLRLIIVLRHPQEVSGSLLKRDAIDPTWGSVLWLWYVLEAIKWSSGYKRIVIKYDDLLNNWSGLIARISEELEITWPIPVDRARNEIESFLDKNMRHHYQPVESDKKNQNIDNLAIAVYNGLLKNDINLDEYEGKFRNELLKLSPYLKTISNSMLRTSILRNDVRNLENKANNLESELKIAREQINSKDQLITELHKKMDSFWFALKRPIIILVKKILL